MSERRPGYVVLGQVAGLYGVTGWVKVVSYTRPRENLLAYDHWWLYQGGGWTRYARRASRVQGKNLIAALEGVRDREQARAIIGVDIAVERDQLPPLSAGEYYWVDLIGLTVVRKDGVPLGQVVHLEETGGHDVLVVRGPGPTEHLIPYVTGVYVLAVDLDSGTITVDWPVPAGE